MIALGDVLQDICRLGAPTPRPRLKMRELIAIGQRYRRKADGVVVRVEQVHRADRLVEAKVQGAAATGCRVLLDFDTLAADYELLVSLGGAR